MQWWFDAPGSTGVDVVLASDKPFGARVGSAPFDDRAPFESSRDGGGGGAAALQPPTRATPTATTPPAACEEHAPATAAAAAAAAAAVATVVAVAAVGVAVWVSRSASSSGGAASANLGHDVALIAAGAGAAYVAARASAAPATPSPRSVLPTTATSAAAALAIKKLAAMRPRRSTSIAPGSNSSSAGNRAGNMGSTPDATARTARLTAGGPILHIPNSSGAQPAAARWRRAMSKVVAVGRFAGSAAAAASSAVPAVQPVRSGSSAGSIGGGGGGGGGGGSGGARPMRQGSGGTYDAATREASREAGRGYTNLRAKSAPAAETVAASSPLLTDAAKDLARAQLQSSQSPFEAAYSKALGEAHAGKSDGGQEWATKLLVGDIVDLNVASSSVVLPALNKDTVRLLPCNVHQCYAPRPVLFLGSFLSPSPGPRSPLWCWHV